MTHPHPSHRHRRTVHHAVYCLHVGVEQRLLSRPSSTSGYFISSCSSTWRSMSRPVIAICLGIQQLSSFVTVRSRMVLLMTLSSCDANSMSLWCWSSIESTPCEYGRIRSTFTVVSVSFFIKVTFIPPLLNRRITYGPRHRLTNFCCISD